MYKELIDRLLEWEAEEMGGNAHFLSAYLPSGAVLRKDLETRVKSRLKTAGTPGKVVERVLKSLGKIEDYGSGVAIFSSYDPKQVSKLRPGAVFPAGGLELIVLSLEPRTEVSIGKVFDLDQLIWANNRSCEAVVLSLGRKEAKVYELSQGRLSLVGKEKNEFVLEREDEYVERIPAVSKGRTKSVSFGQASDKLERKQDKENYRFVSFLANKYGDAENLIIVHSQNFANFAEKFGDDALLIDKPVSEKAQIEKVVLESLKKRSDRTKSSRLEKARKRFGRFRDSWNEVTKASRHNKIKILFLDPKAKKPGYILDREFVYTYPVKGSKRVENVAPWITRSAYKAESEIVLLDSRKKNTPEIAALLRY